MRKYEYFREWKDGRKDTYIIEGMNWNDAMEFCRKKFIDGKVHNYKNHGMRVKDGF